MSASVSGIRGGQPSIATPIAGPWLSPHVVKRKSVPKEFDAILFSYLIVDEQLGGDSRASAYRMSALFRIGCRLHSIEHLGKLLGFIDRDHANGVVPGIDMKYFAGYSRTHIAKQEQGRMPNFNGGNVAF
jgi:hypothetical protein